MYTIYMNHTVHVNVCMYMYVCMYVCMYICMYVSMYVLRVHVQFMCPPDPQLATDFLMDYLERVKTVHESGGYGSTG